MIRKLKKFWEEVVIGKDELKELEVKYELMRLKEEASAGMSSFLTGFYATKSS